ncbi:MAG TPA: methyltransferase domain-containing protein [Vicinamibacterales bacterium]|nr:methyltransferase domain-containing protein [Vicinamibacterales bacterium]
MPLALLHHRLRAGALLIACLNLGALQKQDDAADAARLIEMLDIRPGSTVADVGAGPGPLVPLMSRHVGPSGRLYATDINADRLGELRKLATSESLPNVTVLEGAAARTNLPDGCCEAIFMRHVYHHFADPNEMNASLLRSLKPGGRLAVLDFAPTAGKSSPPGSRNEGDAHGVMAVTVIEELKAVGFVDVREVSWPSRSVAVMARRPDSLPF